MMPIPFLSPALPIAAPGVSPAIMPAGTRFDALLPGVVAPVLPRQRDAEGGNALPATDLGENDADETAWVSPLLWQTVCPPVDAMKGEGGAGAAPINSGGTTPTVVAPPVRPSAVALGSSLTAAPNEVIVTGEIVALPKRRLAASKAAVAGEPVLPSARSPMRDQVPLGIQAFALPAPPQSDAAHVTTLFPGEGRGPVTSSPILGPGLRRGTTVEGSAMPSPELRVAAIASPVLAAVASLTPSAPLTTEPTAAGTTQSLKPLDNKAPGSAERAPATAVEIAQPAARPAPAELPPTRIAPASQMFAAAIQRAVRDERRPATSDPTPGLLTPIVDLATRPITIDTPRHAPLDMARETWPTKMIERIELLRDAVDAVDTSIRLMPDKLGAIDVSLRRDGDGVQVQFTAQAAETRQLLAEAQPKLAELAEAKGLRLSMHSGDGGGQPHQQQRAAASAPSIIASRASSADEDATADERVA